MACFSSKRTKKDYCMINEFHPVTDTSRPGLVYNEFECPLYILSKYMTVVPSTMIENVVSFVHQCDMECTFKETRVNRTQERETVSVNRLTFIHNLFNRSYCLNVFCII